MEGGIDVKAIGAGFRVSTLPVSLTLACFICSLAYNLPIVLITAYRDVIQP